MAYDLSMVNGYGTGALGDVTNPTGQLCSYANVASVTEVAVATNAITINAPSNGAYEKFEVGTEILLHVSGCLSGTTAEWLGKYIVCKITGVQTSALSANGKILIIDKKITDVLPVAQFAAHILQAITIPQFKTLTVTGTIAPIAYNPANKYGGILPIKCLVGLVMSGSGKINLVDMGIPVANKALRYWTLQECDAYNKAVAVATTSNGLLDTDKYSAWENHITVRQLLLNAGDGVGAIWAKKITNTESSTTTRIGATAGGVQFCRGANDSKGYNETKPANTTNIGGSTIMLVADDLDGFKPSMIAKYRDSTKTLGQGLGRCYIALKNQVLRNDEGLYAFDIISDQQRLMRDLSIKSYGSGRHGDVTNPTISLNNYAKVTAIGGGGKSITYDNLTKTGIADFSDGAMVMFHISKHLDNSDMGYLGKFIMAKVISHDAASKVVYLDTNVLKCLPFEKLDKYNVQLVSVFEPKNLTINTNYNATTKWDDAKKIGGLCAIACKNICNIENGMINVEDKGGGNAYGREGLAFIGNAQIADRLPIGQGHGSIFLLANIGKINAITRIGSTYDGSKYGGGVYGGGYAGKGSGAGFGGFSRDDGDGGYGGANGCHGSAKSAGAHLFVIINKLNKLPFSALSTGGNGFYGAGGAGYGGAGGASGINGGGFASGGARNGVDVANSYSGGASGWCFMYVKEVTEFDTIGVIAV